MKDEQLLNKQAKDLEEIFFVKGNERVLHQLREKSNLEEKRKALRAVVKAKDPAIIEHLLKLGVGPGSVLAVTLVPLSAVAWADGRLDDKERKAVLQAASERGVRPGSADYTMLEVWLKQKPSQRLMDAWKKYARGVWEQLPEDERVHMRVNIVGRAREIAKAAGDVMGAPSISPVEEALLEELERVLS